MRGWATSMNASRRIVGRVGLTGRATLRLEQTDGRPGSVTVEGEGTVWRQTCVLGSFHWRVWRHACGIRPGAPAARQPKIRLDRDYPAGARRLIQVAFVRGRGMRVRLIGGKRG